MKLITRRRSRPAALASALLAAALVVAACGEDDADPEDAADPGEVPAEEEMDEALPFLTMATGSTGGTYFPLGGAIAGVWSTHIDGLDVSPQASGASVENLQLLEADEIQLAMSINGTAANMLAEEGNDITFIGNVYKEVNQIVARTDADIATVEDLDGKTVAIGPPGSGTEVFARAIFERAGIEPGEIRQETFGEAADLLRDGSIDATFGILALPAGSLEEVANAVDLNLVSLEGDLLTQTLADDPTLTEIQYDGEYTNIDQDATLVTNWASIYAKSTLNEQSAYDLARVLYDHNEEIAAAHAVGHEIQLDTAIDGVGDIPIHPGALRYYEEQGLQ
jgi:uncharacterized protein